MKYIPRTSTWLIGILTATLTACVIAPNTYKASGSDKTAWGYSDVQVDGALFRVNYLARAQTSVDETYVYAMYRAAELARSKGATHFEVLEGMIDRAAIDRFLAQPLKTSDFYDPSAFQVLNVATLQLEQPSELAGSPNPPAMQALPVRTVRYVAPTYIYVPLQPPPPPKRISLLLRLLNAPSLDPVKGFEVHDLLTKLGPRIVRQPVTAL